MRRRESSSNSPVKRTCSSRVTNFRSANMKSIFAISKTERLAKFKNCLNSHFGHYLPLLPATPLYSSLLALRSRLLESFFLVHSGIGPLLYLKKNSVFYHAKAVSPVDHQHDITLAQFPRRD